MAIGPRNVSDAENLHVLLGDTGATPDTHPCAVDVHGRLAEDDAPPLMDHGTMGLLKVPRDRPALTRLLRLDMRLPLYDIALHINTSADEREDVRRESLHPLFHGAGPAPTRSASSSSSSSTRSMEDEPEQWTVESV